ncbi:DUF4082 domain-containing protein [Nonomuraea sp. NPDC049695]|uniref:DUF4082 domain-containing protein n=1 Tax=Nonomuraea sp. NPDC049695 TaxID=3154734 RepID=UPI0034373706
MTVIAALIASGLVVVTPGTAAAAPSMNLDDAASFGVLASTSVANTNQTAITGDLGVSPGSTVSGFPPGTVSGSTHAGDATAAAAKADAVAAYNEADGSPATAFVAAQLGGTTKTPGVYRPSSGSVFQINGTLTLDAQYDPAAVFLFKAASLSTANVSNISLTNGAQADNVFFQLTDAATLGTNSTFQGNVLASDGVTVNSGAAVKGRVFSITDAVTLQGTTTGPKTRITVPNDPPTTTTLDTSPNPSRNGQTVTMSATVSAVSGDVVPQGEVAFKDGTTLLGHDFVDEQGDVSIQVPLSGGNHQLTAVYQGGDTFDGEAFIHFAPSTSPPVAQVVMNTLWSNSATPAVANADDTRAAVLGVKFRAATTGLVKGIRFYKGSQNTGTHVGALWTSGGTQLASVTFSGESASGWQQALFSTPVSINANTTYVASYSTTTGHFSYTLQQFTSEVSNPPLTALADGADGGNGVYAYSATNTFPTSSYQASNYWVEPLFLRSDTLWEDSATPAIGNADESRAVVLGVKFRSATAGVIRGVRFYKGTQNTGTHVGTLWTSGGTQLASVTFSGESASGWQQAYFSTPVSINANTTYIASYQTTTGHFSYTLRGFYKAQSNYPLTALEGDDSGGNGVYVYSATNTFPSNSFQDTNYWVDVLFDNA